MLMKNEKTSDRGLIDRADVQQFEQVPLADQYLPTSTYDMLSKGMSINPDAVALSFFLRTTDYRRPFTWTHRDLLAEITRTANALRRLGIERGNVVAFVLPNLPETHLVIWGGEAAGVTFAINPLLDAAQIAELLQAGKAKWLVTLEPTPGTDIWQKVSKAAAEVSALKGILTVSIAPYLRGPLGLALRLKSRAKRLRVPNSAIKVSSLVSCSNSSAIRHAPQRT